MFFYKRVFKITGAANDISFADIELAAKKIVLNIACLFGVLVASLTVGVRLAMGTYSLAHQGPLIAASFLFVFIYFWSRKKERIELAATAFILMVLALFFIRYFLLFSDGLLYPALLSSSPGIIVVFFGLKGRLWASISSSAFLLPGVLYYFINWGTLAGDELFLSSLLIAWTLLLIIYLSVLDGKNQFLKMLSLEYEQRRVSTSLTKRLFHELLNPLNVGMGYLEIAMVNMKSGFVCPDGAPCSFPTDCDKLMQCPYAQLFRVSNSLSQIDLVIRKMATYTRSQNLSKLVEKHKSDVEILDSISKNFRREGTAKVLFVDDSKEARELFKVYMKGMPYDILFAENGLDALERVKQGDIDLVFMDIMMPIMDGHEATSKIRSWEWENNFVPIPILALSAYSLQEDRFKSIDAGCNIHLTKPITKVKLQNTLERYI